MDLRALLAQGAGRIAAWERVPGDLAYKRTNHSAGRGLHLQVLLLPQIGLVGNLGRLGGKGSEKSSLAHNDQDNLVLKRSI